MSRHRDVRALKYSDEYDGFDDIYGHSVEDDIAMSPGDSQFIYDRNKSADVSSFMIQEDDEEPTRPELSELDTARLMSCIEVIKNVIGDNVTEATMTNEIIKANFDAEIALNKILNPTTSTNLASSDAHQHPEHQSGSSTKKFCTLSSKNISSLTTKFPIIKKDNEISSLSQLMNNHNEKLNDLSVKTPEKKLFNSLNDLVANHSSKNDKIDSNKSFCTLADLTASHMQKSNSPIAKNNSTFVIPKFSLKSNNNNRANNLPLSPNYLFKKKPVNDVEVLEKELVNIKVSSITPQKKIEIDGDKNDNDKNNEEYDIDLSSVLKKKSTSIPIINKNTELKSPSYNLKDIFLMSSEPIPSSMIVDSLQVLNCQLNSSNLYKKKLNSINRKGSMFGKILCRRWNINKPYIKHSKCEYSDKIKPFDFSSPSPDNIIFANLRRK